VFEIGSNLREARTRQGRRLEDAEREIRIRAKYLAALEEERFEQLPAEAYAISFLRSYADFLGLDSELFVTELHARFVAARPPSPPPPPAWGPLVSRVTLRAVATAAAGAAILAGLILAWRFGESGQPQGPPLRPMTTSTVGPPTTGSAPAKHNPQKTSGRTRLHLTAERGDCWISVRVGSREGSVLYEGVLPAGQTMRFTRKRLWVRLGAPWNVQATVNGRVVRGLPNDTGNVVFTTRGVRPG
jgi:cytoskeleton protein RodZ